MKTALASISISDSCRHWAESTVPWGFLSLSCLRLSDTGIYNHYLVTDRAVLNVSVVMKGAMKGGSVRGNGG